MSENLEINKIKYIFAISTDGNKNSGQAPSPIQVGCKILKKIDW